MTMKNIFRKIAVSALAGAVIFAGAASLGNTPAFAESQPAVPQTAEAVSNQEVDEQTPSYTASITIPQQDSNVDESKDNGNEVKEDAALASQAKISADEALKAAIAAYPAYSSNKAELGNENGNLIYEVKLIGKAGEKLEVKVDAGNAAILATDNGADDKQEAADNEKGGNQENESNSGTDTDNVQEEVKEG